MCWQKDIQSQTDSADRQTQGDRALCRGETCYCRDRENMEGVIIQRIITTLNYSSRVLKKKENR